MASSKCFQSDELPLDTIIVSSLHQDLALDAVPHALYGSDRWRSYGSDRWRRDQMTIKKGRFLLTSALTGIDSSFDIYYYTIQGEPSSTRLVVTSCRWYSRRGFQTSIVIATSTPGLESPGSAESSASGIPSTMSPEANNDPNGPQPL